MKTDWRIIGKLYRTSRRRTVLVCGLTTREEATTILKTGSEGGAIDPNAWVQSCRVSDTWTPADTWAGQLTISVH